MIILTTSIGYGPGELSIFWDSLIETGFKGDVVIVSNDCNFLSNAETIPDPDNGYPVNSRRFLAYSEFLKGVDEPVVITDIRDVIFQKNPEQFMPTDGLNVFEEAEGKRIIDCGYNFMWMDELGVNKWNLKPIICSGVTSGSNIYDYCREMWDRLIGAPTIAGIDQAVHNDLIYSGLPAAIHKNEDAEVYTVGHLPLESVEVRDGFILNKSGETPCMVHMYDRHVNLTVAAIQRLQLKLTKERG